MHIFYQSIDVFIISILYFGRDSIGISSPDEINSQIVRGMTKGVLRSILAIL